jgi:hypothetical protein
LAFGFELASPHPLAAGTENFMLEYMRALNCDKKKRNGSLVFIAPDEKSARPIHADSIELKNTISRIINGEIALT